MYAIVKCGGKQLKVQAGDIVKVEKLDTEVNGTVELTEVLMVADDAKVTVGTPLVKGAAVTATVIDQIKDDKVIVFKKKRRQGYRRKYGHRQQLTVLKVGEIKA
ncbi:MAG: 50S ribosomal protein L21 [Proteobacteria bacterium]|jgi:large subunit ribosomal protein L21|nr:MAG: 50S ribosomal protein L21 [Pseudomonadota bacterium]|tara:strand:+ start:181 stop:492 length:312 start_codon:yes stop_codon:yes gene_type:complete